MKLATCNILYFEQISSKKNGKKFNIHFHKSKTTHQTLLIANMSISNNSTIENRHYNIERISHFFNNLYNMDKDAKLHLFDNQGTLAIIQIEKNQAWINNSRTSLTTNFSFDCEVSTTTALTKVNRKETIILNDWVWNLFWNTQDIAIALSPEDGHFRIHYWPKPFDHNTKKIIFQLAACFIQGGKISTISEQLNIPIDTVRRFIGANITINNIEKINIWDKHYTPPVSNEKSEDVSFIKNFFNSLRKKLNL